MPKYSFRSLYWKISGLFTILLVLIGMIYILMTIYTSQMYVEEATQKISAPIAKHIVAKIDPFVGDEVNWQALQRIFAGATMLNPGIEIYLLDQTGKILASSIPNHKVVRQMVALGPIEACLRDNGEKFVLGDDPRNANAQKVFSVAPVLMQNSLKGFVYVILRGEEYDSVMRRLVDSYFLQLGTWAFIITLGSTALMALLVLSLMMKKLRNMTEVVHALEHGEYSRRITIRSNDELDQLGDAFNSMANTIVSHMEEIQKTDSLRRELVANVSHDLRTPLSSVQGYVETMLLKDDTLSVEERKQYLEIVLNSTQNLTSLVEELFTFSQLDTQQVKPNFEAFSIAELVQDIVQKFQPQAQKARIRIRAIFHEELPFVSADIGMIERALQNLIDNAIRYTPQIGVVTVELVLEGSQVVVKVGDTGEGISREELPHIFDRFYRGQKSRSRTSRGSGLGLAITKKIVELHHSQIDVSSTLNAGTTFSFSLAVDSQN